MGGHATTMRPRAAPPRPPDDQSGVRIVENSRAAKGGTNVPSPPTYRAQRMRLALYEPDIPQNTGALLRLGACLGTSVDVIEPCGFALTDQRLRRAAMDYIGQVDWHRHVSWSAYLSARQEKAGGRLVLLSTRGRLRHIDMAYRPDDTFLLGRESAGVPTQVWRDCDSSVRVPLAAGTRSLNIVTAAAIVLAEALRQTRGFAEVPDPSCQEQS